MEILDEDGYPTEEFLTTIETWDWKNGFEALLDYALKGHIYPTYWEKEDREDHWLYSVSTGGWSGNEAILCALRANTMFWMQCWLQSKRGGHFQFSVKKT